MYIPPSPGPRTSLPRAEPLPPCPKDTSFPSSGRKPCQMEWWVHQPHAWVMGGLARGVGGSDETRKTQAVPWESSVQGTKGRWHESHAWSCPPHPSLYANPALPSTCSSPAPSDHSDTCLSELAVIIAHLVTLSCVAAHHK